MARFVPPAPPSSPAAVSAAGFFAGVSLASGIVAIAIWPRPAAPFFAGVGAFGLVVAWIFHRGVRRLGYEVRDGSVVVRTAFLSRELRASDVVSLERTSFRIPWWVRNRGIPGYRVGRVCPEGRRGLVKVYTANLSGEGVLLTLRNGEQVLLEPRDPETVVAALGGERRATPEERRAFEMPPERIRQAARRLAFLVALVDIGLIAGAVWNREETFLVIRLSVAAVIWTAVGAYILRSLSRTAEEGALAPGRAD